MGDIPLSKGTAESGGHQLPFTSLVKTHRWPLSCDFGWNSVYPLYKGVANVHYLLMNRYFLRVGANKPTKLSAQQKSQQKESNQACLTVDPVFTSAGSGSGLTWATEFWNPCVSSFSSFSFAVEFFPPHKSLRGRVGCGPAPIKVSGSAATASLWVSALSHCITFPTAIGYRLFQFFSSPSAHNGQSIFQTEKVPLHVPKSLEILEKFF